MEKPVKNYIILFKGNINIRCHISSIVCVVSVGGNCMVYEHLQHTNQPIRLIECSHRLPWFKSKITDPYFFEVKKGTLFNTRYFHSLSADRTLISRVTDVPHLIVSRKALKAFKEHLEYW